MLLLFICNIFQTLILLYKAFFFVELCFSYILNSLIFYFPIFLHNRYPKQERKLLIFFVE